MPTTKSTVATTAVVAAASAIAWARLRTRRRLKQMPDNGLAARSPPDEPSSLKSPSVALTPPTIRLLLSTCDEVGSTTTADRFYDCLFKIAPEMRSLFGPSEEGQSSKFADMMRWTARALGELMSANDVPGDTGGGGTDRANESIAKSMRSLGERHVSYGIRLGHFLPVKRAFLETIASMNFACDPSELPRSAASSVQEVTRAWESLLYAYVGEMGPVLLPFETLASYRLALGNELAAPAGGTATALAGSQGVALLQMAARLTRNPPEGIAATLKEIEGRLERSGSALEELAKQDMKAYCRVMVAVRQPPLGDLYSQRKRREAIGSSLQSAAKVPLLVAEWSIHALHDAIILLPLAAKSGAGDAGAGSMLLIACARTALQNVRINVGTREELREVATRGDGFAETLDWQERQLGQLMP